MKIALVTLQGNPFGQTPEAGPDRQDRRLASLVSALAEQDHDVTVYARRDSETQPEKSEPAPGVTVEHVPAGPARELPADSLAPHAAEFGQYLARHWQDAARGRSPALESYDSHQGVAQVCSTGDVELGEDPIQVPPDSAVREEQALADLAVRQSFGRELGNLEFLWGEFVARFAAEPAREEAEDFVLVGLVEVFEGRDHLSHETYSDAKM